MKMKIILYLLTAFILVCMATSCNTLDRSETSLEESAADSENQDTSAEEEETGTASPETNTSGDEENNEADMLSDLIIVTDPLPDQLITSPLIITGKARGTWFFEANFPVSLLDSNENVLALHYAATEEEWMTEDFISFTAIIEFDDPVTATGFLVLDKNNPSDIREYDAQLIIPVRFE
jgi:hypothetical protein